MRKAFRLVILFSAMLLSFAPSQPQAATSKGLDTVFLIDRSPSAGAPQRNSHLIDTLADQTLKEIVGLTRQQQIPLFFGSTNFGGFTSDPRPLEPIPSDASPQLPRREVIPYTDFRVALSYALEQIDRGEKLYGRHKTLIVLFTDSEPWPPGRRLSAEEKESYFRGTGQFNSPTGLSLSESIRMIHDHGGKLVVMAANDNPSDAILWRSYVEPTNYISTRGGSDSTTEAKRVLEEIVQEAGQELNPLNKSASPAVSTRPPEQQTSNFTVWLIGFLAVITVGFLFVLIRQRTLIGRQNSSIADLRKNIEKLRTARDEELNTVEDLEEKAGAVARKDKGQAIEIYKEALDKRVDLLGKTDLAGSRAVSDTVSKILDLCDGNLEREWQLISEMLGEGRRREVVNGVAPVLLQRWSTNKEVLLKEFCRLQAEPLGIYLLDGLIKVANQRDRQTGAFATAIGQMASAARELHQIRG